MPKKIQVENISKNLEVWWNPEGFYFQIDSYRGVYKISEALKIEVKEYENLLKQFGAVRRGDLMVFRNSSDLRNAIPTIESYMTMAKITG